MKFHQSNIEGEIVNFIHQAIDKGAGIIINPAGYSFTSVPILDALKRRVEREGIKLGDLLQPIRVAITGTTVSEPVSDCLCSAPPQACRSRESPSPARRVS